MARSLATTRIMYPKGCMPVVSSVQPSPGAGAVCTALALILRVIDGVDTGVGGPAWLLSVRRPGVGISRRMRGGCTRR
jgi:hypothetical protein